MTPKLYFAPGACSFVPHTLLESAEAPFTPTMVKLHKGEQNGDEYKAINPRGQVPVLMLSTPSGPVVVTQIVAIVNFIHDTFPHMQFLPDDPLAKAKALETLAWMNNTVHPTFTHIFMPQKFADNSEVHADLKRYNTQLFAQQLADIDAMVYAMQATGRTFLTGDHFGPLDAYTITLLRWGGIAGIDPTQFVSAWTHVNTVAALPTVARVIERERLVLNMYKPA